MLANFHNLDLLEILLALPLDQFGDDEDSAGLLDNHLVDLLPGRGYLEDLLDFLGITELDSVMSALGMQASIFRVNLLGMVPSVETVTSEASLTFLFSIATMVTFILVGLSILFFFSTAIVFMLEFFTRSDSRYFFVPFSKDRLITFGLPNLGFTGDQSSRLVAIFVIWIILEVFVRFILKWLKKSKSFLRIRAFMGYSTVNPDARRQSTPPPKEKVIILGPGTAMIKYVPPLPMVRYIVSKTALVPYKAKSAPRVLRGIK